MEYQWIDYYSIGICLCVLDNPLSLLFLNEACLLENQKPDLYFLHSVHVYLSIDPRNK